MDTDSLPTFWTIPVIHLLSLHTVFWPSSSTKRKQHPSLDEKSRYNKQHKKRKDHILKRANTGFNSCLTFGLNVSMSETSALCQSIQCLRSPCTLRNWARELGLTFLVCCRKLYRKPQVSDIVWLRRSLSWNNAQQRAKGPPMWSEEILNLPEGC